MAPSTVLGLSLERDTPTWAAQWRGCCDSLGEEVAEPGWRPTDTPVSACTIWEMNWSFSAQFPVSGITAGDGSCQLAVQPQVLSCLLPAP